MRRGRRLPAVAASVSVVAGALFASGCGGAARQDASEPKVTATLAVAHAGFPRVQSIARPTYLELLVANVGTSTAPNVAVTINSFNYASNYPELASTQRPVWVVDAGPGEIPTRPAQSQAVSPPGGGQTNYVNTWALGALPPRGVRRFRWRLVPVTSGLHTVRYTVAAGLAGKAKAVSPSGGPVQGRFTVFITHAPPPRHVNPNTGQVEPGPYPYSPSSPSSP